MDEGPDRFFFFKLYVMLTLSKLEGWVLGPYFGSLDLRGPTEYVSLGESGQLRHD